MGAIIRYASNGSPKQTAIVQFKNDTGFGPKNIPDTVRLEVYQNKSEPAYYQYVFTHPIKPNAMKDKELEEKVSPWTMDVVAFNVPGEIYRNSATQFSFFSETLKIDPLPNLF